MRYGTRLAWTVVVVIVACAMTLVWTRSAGDVPRIRDWQPGTGGGIAKTDTKGGTPYAFDDATVCLTRRGSVVVERVDVVRPTGGLRVEKFAFRPTRQGHIYNYVSDAHQRLVDVGYPTEGPMVVDRRCVANDGPPGRGEGASLVGL